jgi:hypothetical protein
VNSTRGTGFATPFLRFKVSKVIEAFKRFGRGYKPRPASAPDKALRRSGVRPHAGRGLQPRS